MVVHPWDCPEWDYENHSEYTAVLRRKIERVLLRLRRHEYNCYEAIVDTREVHFDLFEQLVPRGFEYFAGHYRGEDFRCLRSYEVGVRGDSRVGVKAADVLQTMQQFGAAIVPRLEQVDRAFLDPESPLSEDQKLDYVVSIACRWFELFLRIHPYANGNGHLARFAIWLLIGRYGYWPVRWPIDPRPPDPPYTRLIMLYRNGHREPLERWILACIRKAPL